MRMVCGKRSRLMYTSAGWVNDDDGERHYHIHTYTCTADPLLAATIYITRPWLPWNVFRRRPRNGYTTINRRNPKTLGIVVYSYFLYIYICVCVSYTYMTRWRPVFNVIIIGLYFATVHDVFNVYYNRYYYYEYISLLHRFRYKSSILQLLLHTYYYYHRYVLMCVYITHYVCV